jgi:plastocyanin
MSMEKPRSAHDALRRAAILVAVGGLVGIAPTAYAETLPATQTVDIAKSLFTPQEITVAPGTKVVWTNHDEMPHTVTSRDKAFASQGLDTDDKFEHVFNREGDFEYRCVVHPYMTGVVHVRK